MKRDFHYLCPNCSEETTIHDCYENMAFVFCFCETDEHGDGVVMELQNPPAETAYWSINIDFSIGGRTIPTADEIKQIASFMKEGCTNGEFESHEFADDYY